MATQTRGLDSQDPEDGQSGHPGKDDRIGIGASCDEADKREGGNGALHGTRDIGRTVDRMDLAQSPDGEPFASKRVEIPVQRVVEGQDAGKEAGDQQDIHDLRRPSSEDGVGSDEIEGFQAAAGSRLHL